MPSDVSAAITAQNTQVTAGQLGGAAAVVGQQLNATVTAQSRLQTDRTIREHHPADQHDRAQIVRINDVARSRTRRQESMTPSRATTASPRPAGISLATGANAISDVGGREEVAIGQSATVADAAGEG
jgi:multidrug efflux pump